MLGHGEETVILMAIWEGTYMNIWDHLHVVYKVKEFWTGKVMVKSSKIHVRSKKNLQFLCGLPPIYGNVHRDEAGLG